MTMVERVARALCVAAGDDPDGGFNPMLPRWRDQIDAARAAIEAMKPTDAMLIAGSAAMVGPLTSSSSVWQAMRQAALEGEG